jgi:hypothetical protein
MALFNCCCKRDCTLLAVIASLILGIVAAFLQITAVITVTPAFLWVALGIAVVYLGVLVVTTGLSRRSERRLCLCNALDTVLTGILGTILFSVVLLAVGIVATSVVSAILVGLLVASFTLLIAGTVCIIRNLFACGN